jgi:8-oxo-dGTP diphosphatase
MNIVKATVAADIIITYDDGSIILIKRRNEPYKDQWALPGGIMDEFETIEQTAVREAKEETGLDIKLDHLIGVYSKPGRDPRGRTVSVLFSATAISGILKANDDACDILRTKDFFAMDLAFDHNEMINDYFNFYKKEKK